MTGGIVIGTASKADRISLVVSETQNSSKTGIDIESNFESLLIYPGDTVWWQEGFLYWTPIDRHEINVPIRAIGHSYRVN